MEKNILGLIGIIGAILMIVGVFLKWLSFLGFGDASGWDVFNSWRGDYGYGFVPLIALISGIVSLCLMIAPTFIKADHLKKVFVVLGVIAMILAIITLIASILFYIQSWTVAGVTVKLTDIYEVGIGFWLVLAGSIITVIGGLVPVLANRK